MNYAMIAILGLGGGELMLILVALVLLGALVAGLVVAAVFLTRYLSRPATGAPTPIPPPYPSGATLTCGRQMAEHVNLAGSQYQDVNLSGAFFDNVNLTNARFHNVNLSNVSISAAQIGGAFLKHVGPPPDKDGKQDRQRPVRFEEMMLCDSTFHRVDLSNVRVTECNLAGMTIDGVLVTDLIGAYKRESSH